MWEKSYMSPGRNPQIFNSLGQTADDVIPSKTTLFYRRHINYTSYENLELEVPFAIRTIVHLKQKEIFYATLSKNTGY